MLQQGAPYGLDPRRFAAWRASAGGRLVALLGTSAGAAALEDFTQGNAGESSAVHAVVDWYGSAGAGHGGTAFTEAANVALIEAFLDEDLR